MSLQELILVGIGGTLLGLLRYVWWRDRSKWEARRSGWPYPPGYAVYHPGRRTVLDTGLTRDDAQAIADDLNRRGVLPGGHP